MYQNHTTIHFYIFHLQGLWLTALMVIAKWIVSQCTAPQSTADFEKCIVVSF